MPYSLRVKIKGLRYKGIITDRDCDRLCKALDNENVLDKIREAVKSIDTRYYSSVYGMDMTECADDFKHEILLIIDKYRNEVGE